MSSFLFSQMVQVPTHINLFGSDSLLDLVLVSDSARVSSCLPIPPLANSDHLGLCLLLFTSVPRYFSTELPKLFGITSMLTFRRLVTYLISRLGFCSSLW